MVLNLVYLQIGSFILKIKNNNLKSIKRHSYLITKNKIKKIKKIKKM